MKFKKLSNVLHPRFTNYHLLALLISIVLLSSLQYILNEIEVEAKTELWMKQNEEYLREQKGKQKREEELNTCAFINTIHILIHPIWRQKHVWLRDCLTTEIKKSVKGRILFFLNPQLAQWTTSCSFIPQLNLVRLVSIFENT